MIRTVFSAGKAEFFQIRSGSIPASPAFHPPRGAVILVLHQERLWGPYRVLSNQGGMVRLRKGRGKAVFYWRPEKSALQPHEVQGCFSRFREGNMAPQETLLSIVESQGEWRCQKAGRHLESLVSPPAPLPAGALALCGKLVKLAGSNRGENPMGARNELRRHGRLLGEAITPCGQSNGVAERYVYEAPHHFLPQAFYSGGFWGLTRRLVRQKPVLRGTGRGLLPRRGLGLAASSWQADGAMGLEVERLRRLWRLCRDPVLVRQGQLDREGLSRMLEQVRLFHFTGHGHAVPSGPADDPLDAPHAGLRLEGGGIFDEASVHSLARTPAFVFLSCCGDFTEGFVDAWFRRGTRCLIYPRGPLKSETMPAFCASFYWNWMHRREGVDGALLAARRRFGRSDWNWLLLELAGDPNVRF